MRVLVNALSVTAPSGRHVLYGHLRALANGPNQHELDILCHATEVKPAGLCGPNVQWLPAPAVCRHWLIRSAWEVRELPRLLQQQGADLYFTPTGTVLPRCSVPQVSLAQNPWCLVPGLARSVSERAKARLQRRAYRNAYQHAAMMVYNSEHMRNLYRRNASRCVERASIVAHQAIDDETHARAAALRRLARPRPLTILSASVMAHWKGAETLVRALRILHDRGVSARLRLVGPWPDPAYAALVRREIVNTNLSDYVDITGHVPVERLHEYYADARAFCLMSRCESFGIPAVEAQAFGTPVVGSSTTAMPEICGDGGLYGPPGSAGVAADLLSPLLTDDGFFHALSKRAIANAERYRWSVCSRPLTEILDTNCFGAGQPDVAIAV